MPVASTWVLRRRRERRGVRRRGGVTGGGDDLRRRARSGSAALLAFIAAALRVDVFEVREALNGALEAAGAVGTPGAEAEGRESTGNTRSTSEDGVNNGKPLLGTQPRAPAA